MNDNHVFASLLQSLAVFKQSSWTTFALSRCQDRKLKFTYGCEQKFSEIVICFLFPYRIISGIKWRQHTFFSRLTDPSFVSFAGFSETQKEVISIKSWFFLNIDKWTSSNEENWTKFLSQSYGNLTPSLRRSKLTFTLLCALNFLYCSCG